MKTSRILKTDFPLRNGCKKVPIIIRIPKDEIALLNECWKMRTYPNPYNVDKQIKFRSRQEYLEFVILSTNKAGGTIWYILKHILNRDFPLEKK